MEIEVKERAPRSALLRALGGNAEAVAETIHIAGETMWQMWRFSGPATAMSEVRRVIEGPLSPPVVSTMIVQESQRRLLGVSRWRRPVESDGATIACLLATLAWSEALVQIRIRDGTVGVRAVAEDCEVLRSLQVFLESRFTEAFRVSVVRVGEVRESAPAPVEVLDLEDAKVLELAIAMGYYDRPKRCGVRELGAMLGLSRTAVSRRLRAIEDIAVKNLKTPTVFAGGPFGRPAHASDGALRHEGETAL